MSNNVTVNCLFLVAQLCPGLSVILRDVTEEAHREIRQDRVDQCLPYGPEPHATSKLRFGHVNDDRGNTAIGRGRELIYDPELFFEHRRKECPALGEYFCK